ncbi:MAG: UDP-N-acetylglucosamine diphosphorylase/glucosamine-1-phosphate N-acetyltransferase [Gammaproteobacteria bacterium]|nr:UDP-N-acetylglucosamine diphosphorylase/glucosamine-1-phosphate N-acetyltransferase [Gammaproteobacteria bacterium]
MRSALPKVLHQIGGKSMLQHIIETSIELNPSVIHVVVGHGKDMVIEAIDKRQITNGNETRINWVEQTEQLGTGHAVMQAISHVDQSSTVLILNGDTPLIQPETLLPLIRSDNSLNLLTVELDDPSGMGRVLRNSEGFIQGIVEHKDANSDQLLVKETNTNCMSGKAHQINKWLSTVKNQNAQNEYYLPDIVTGAVNDSFPVNASQPTRKEEVAGVNSRSDLCKLERIYQTNQADLLLSSGVTLLDSARIDIRGDCQFGLDCIVDVNVIFEGKVSIGKNCFIGANSIIKNSRIGNNCTIEPNSLIDQSIVGNDCNIGPFARLRPGTKLGEKVKIGNFVETKKASIDDESKVNHLSYVGDSLIGKSVNIGAGVITCNYDGVNKHQTSIGDDVFIGSGSQLVAPLNIGKGATIGAGSTITTDAPDEVLTISRSKQKSIRGWVKPSKK